MTNAPLSRLSLRPAALDTFAVLAPSGAVLAIVPRAAAQAELALLAGRAVPPPRLARRWYWSTSISANALGTYANAAGLCT